MRISAVTMVKDEADVIDPLILHMIGSGVDHIVVADNNSTDGTSEKLRDLVSLFPDNLTVIPDPEPGYYQSEKMSRLAEYAIEHFDPDWIIPFDADEIWQPHDPALALWQYFKNLPPHVERVHAKIINHVASFLDIWQITNPFHRIRFTNPNPLPLPKIAFKRPAAAFVINQGNHGVTLSHRNDSHSDAWGLEVRHFPYRSEFQFIHKIKNGAAAYKSAANIPASIGAHWRNYGAVIETHGEEAMISHYRAHFFFDYQTIHRGMCSPVELRKP
jgi:hypothetical protein